MKDSVILLKHCWTVGVGLDWIWIGFRI